MSVYTVRLGALVAVANQFHHVFTVPAEDPYTYVLRHVVFGHAITGTQSARLVLQDAAGQGHIELFSVANMPAWTTSQADLRQPLLPLDQIYFWSSNAGVTLALSAYRFLG